MLHIDLDKNPKHLPYSLQISEQIRNGIVSGKFAAGTGLPSSRQLALELGIARRTVVLAYEELCAQGYCTSQVGHGTVVARIPVLQQEEVIRSAGGLPKWLSTGVPYTFQADNTDTDKI